MLPEKMSLLAVASCMEEGNIFHEDVCVIVKNWQSERFSQFGEQFYIVVG